MSAPAPAPTPAAPSHSVRSPAAALVAHLTGVSASTFRMPAHGSLVQIPATFSVADALVALNDGNVTGAPVYEEVASEVLKLVCIEGRKMVCPPACLLAAIPIKFACCSRVHVVD